jgi:hypothetical protein
MHLYFVTAELHIQSGFYKNQIFRATLAAIGGFLDAFQKVADMATGSRGKIASRELRG